MIIQKGDMSPASLAVVYWIMTLFSSSGLKSVFFCSVARTCFICPTMQLIVLRDRKAHQRISCVKDLMFLVEGHGSKILISCQNHTDLSMPVSSFTSICSITSFFLCKHSASFGEELKTKFENKKLGQTPTWK